MAKASNKKEKEEDQKKVVGPQDLLQSHLSSNKEDHYNDAEEFAEYKVSSGSLKLDVATGGGFGSGLQRFVGFTEGGKTSESLEVMRNFLLSVKNSRGFLVKGEGRLSKEMRDRSGVKFVWKTEEWVEGTCFVLETNNYELVLKIMRDLVLNNPDDNKYIFVLDSMDSLILKSDMDKEINEAAKVAGAPSLTKKFLQRLAIAMNKFGHMCIMIGQVSAKIELDQYGPKDQRQISATGGNAALHFSNWILQFEPRFSGDLIMEDAKAPPDPIKNKILGHWAKIIIKKSPNESSNMRVTYPIRYGRTGGNSIWVEKEIVDMIIMFNLVEKKGSWFTLKDSLVSELKEAGLELHPQHQGENQLSQYFEDNPEITKYMFKKLKALLSS